MTVVEIASEPSVVPYDESLLDQARTQWQFGDWRSLAQLEHGVLQYHPERANLALLAAAGRLQIGHIEEATQFIRYASNWGVSTKLVCQILVAGVYNSLGRAALLAGNVPRALEHFESAIDIGMPDTDRRLLAQARINQQCSELGMPPVPFESGLDRARPVKASRDSHRGFGVVQLAEVKLGDAWAGNTINTVIFRHHGIVTHQGKQTTAFYVDANTLRVVQRNLETNDVRVHDIIGEYNLYDAHNSISLAFDRANHLHICYDHHATQLRYRRSLRPNDITGWADESPMTGKLEEKVTYPTFIQPHHNFPLTLLYRDGVHNKGNAHFKTYDEASRSWTDRPSPILSGSDSNPWTSNAYWNHPAIGHDGSLHLSFVWRTSPLGDEQRINNVNVGYAFSTDNGISWLTSKGRSYQLPITQVNVETVHPVSPGSNLINQCSMALDSQNRPHIVFYADDPDGIPQYQHLRFDGKQWHHKTVLQRTDPFTLKGAGTLQIPISRPEIVLDGHDNAYLITRGDHSQGRMTVTMLPAPDYMWSTENTKIIWDEDLAFAEPVIDRVRWEQEYVLSLLLQHNQQPDHDIGHQSMLRPVTLLDIQFLPKR
ncbi:BNR repeat-containing protein [Burkholderia sp. WP9]|uniref:BNR repeat-containing protein n=1 Tax=Burkholderia sp. WP9 TaxID=1500263 RepID=UPI0015A5347D|nr:BNR repeat-containing protein [Burkholderia sp. WP9]